MAEAWSQQYTPGVASKLMTAEELAELPDDGHFYELVRGELVEVPPAKPLSSVIGGLFFAALLNFVRPRRLGVVTMADGGYILQRNPDTVRAPDAAFIRAERVPDLESYLPAPDVVVEVLSSSDSLTRLRAK